MERQDSGTLSTFVMGAAVGAGIALLFAPEARDQIRKLLSEYMGHAKDEFDNTMHRGTEILDRAVEHGQEFVQKGTEALHETGRQAKGVAESINQSVRGGADGQGDQASAPKHSGKAA